MIEKLKQSRLVNGILLIGGLLSIKFLFSTIQNPILSILSIIASIAIIYFLYRATALHRDHDCDGKISFASAFYFSFRLYAFGAVISSLIIFIYTGFINKDDLEIMIDQGLKAYEAFGVKINDDMYNYMQLIFKPSSFAIIYIFSSLFVSAFWSLIIAAIVKKDKNVFEA